MELVMITLRTLCVADIPACVAIVGRNYDEEYAQDAADELQHMFEKNVVGLSYVVAEEDGVVVGFAGCANTWVDYHVSGIFWVNVRPENQRCGIGKRMVMEVVNILSQNRKHRTDLIILTARSEVQGYYNKIGFKTLLIFGPKDYALMGFLL